MLLEISARDANGYVREMAGAWRVASAAVTVPMFDTLVGWSIRAYVEDDNGEPLARFYAQNILPVKTITAALTDDNVYVTDDAGNTYTKVPDAKD